MLKRSNVIAILLFSIVSVMNLFGGTFISVDAKTIDGKDFSFPDDAVSGGPALFAIAMGTSRESGEVQQAQLLDWDRYIKQQKSALSSLPFYHFPIIDAPRFVQGLIRKGIAKSYESIVPSDKAAVIFIKDTEDFASQAQIPLDDQATVVLVLPNKTIAGFVKGSPSEQSLSLLSELLIQSNSLR